MTNAEGRGRRLFLKFQVSHARILLKPDAKSFPPDARSAPLNRFSARLTPVVCKSPLQYENIQGLHIHIDSY